MHRLAPDGSGSFHKHYSVSTMGYALKQQDLPLLHEWFASLSTHVESAVDSPGNRWYRACPMWNGCGKVHVSGPLTTHMPPRGRVPASWRNLNRNKQQVRALR